MDSGLQKVRGPDSGVIRTISARCFWSRRDQNKAVAIRRPRPDRPEAGSLRVMRGTGAARNELIRKFSMLQEPGGCRADYGKVYEVQPRGAGRSH